MSANIALYGMMGVGKTTVAKALGERLGRRVVDTDDEIVRWRGKPVPQIFLEEGEVRFRAYEATVIRELAKHTDLVLALGGGAVLLDDNVAELALTGVLIELRATPDVLESRLRDEQQGRPLLDAPDLRSRLEDVLNERSDRYAEIADTSVDADGPVPEVVERILEWLRAHPDTLTPSEFEAVMM